jgi:predicted acyltransferase
MDEDDKALARALATTGLVQWMLDLMHRDDPDEVESRLGAIEALRDQVQAGQHPTYGEMGLEILEVQIRMLQQAVDSNEDDD